MHTAILSGKGETQARGIGRLYVSLEGNGAAPVTHLAQSKAILGLSGSWMLSPS